MIHPDYQVWSLWDMLRFYAQSYAAVINNLATASMLLHGEESFGVPPDIDFCRETALTALKDGERSIRELPLSRVVVLQYERLIRDVPKMDRSEIGTLIKELQTNLITDLSSAYCLIIPYGDRERFEQSQPAFGRKVAEVFADANPDIAAAGRCLALDEFTACVFHLMRVLEHGLRALASKVGLPADAVSHENWKNVIDRIESEIRKSENFPKSIEKSTRVQKLSSAAVQFRYFKDAWRNHVSHSRAKYDGREAEIVWNHVRTFMTQMAEEPDDA